MPSEPRPFNPDDLVADYATRTLSIDKLLRKHGINTKTLDDTLDARGVVRWRNVPLRTEIDTAAVVLAYVGGTSLKALAAEHGVSRDAIKKRLLRSGVALRTTQEQMRIIAARRSPEQRRAYALAANAAARGRKAKPTERAKRALTMQGLGWDASTVGQNDLDLGVLLAIRGHEAVPQVACGPYNIDLTLQSVAVEIHGGGWHAVEDRASRERRRLEHLLDAGWHVLVVAAPARWPVSGFTADHVIAFVEEAGSDPAAPRQYRVIRSDGQPLAGGKM